MSTAPAISKALTDLTVLDGEDVVFSCLVRRSQAVLFSCKISLVHVFGAKDAAWVSKDPRTILNVSGALGFGLCAVSLVGEIAVTHN